MAIQFPDDLVVADGRVEVGHIGPEDVRRPPVVDRIEMPVHRALRTAERQRPVAEEVIASREDGVRSFRRLRRGCRPASQHFGAHVSGQCGLEGKATGAAANTLREAVVDGIPPPSGDRGAERFVNDVFRQHLADIAAVPHARPQPHGHPIAGGSRCRPGPPGDFPARHVAQAVHKNLACLAVAAEPRRRAHTDCSEASHAGWFATDRYAASQP